MGARVVSAAVGRAPVFADTASAGAAAIAGLVVATEAPVTGEKKKCCHSGVCGGRRVPVSLQVACGG